MRVLLTGVTGVCGLNVLRTLLEDPSITHVTALSRRPLPSWIVLPGGTSTSPDGSPTHPKLNTVIQPSFQDYSPDQLKGYDGCIWALGRWNPTSSEEENAVVNVDYVDKFLQALPLDTRPPGNPFRFVFVSTIGADPKEKGHMAYLRIKGRAENHILSFEEQHEDTFKAYILRPGAFFPSSKYPKDASHQRSAVEGVINTIFGGVIRAAMGLTTEELGAFAMGAVKGKWDKQPAVYENGEMKRLLRSVQ
ncbi:hypothetical protein PENSPDRAFT_591770 [Peniophora sp. CONT]|nr:hypothetical protein PENSPDRAFT_591770 [Peniophora sp. CONT]